MDTRLNMHEFPLPHAGRPASLTYTLEEKLFPKEARTRSLEKQRRLEQAYRERERAVNDTEAAELLRAYGVDPGGIEQESDGTFHLPVRQHFSDRRLPNVSGRSPEFAYKGGAARALLLRSLGIDPTYQPRDVDIIAFGSESQPGLRQQVAHEFMTEDAAHGGGVEELPHWKTSRKNYFSTRDFTLNEVLATDEEIWVTRQGLLDTLRHVIRLTSYEHDFRSGIGPKMLAKLLRLSQEGIRRWGDAEVVQDGWSFEEAFTQPFWLALQLDKACEQSLELGQAYVDEVRRLGFIPDNVQSIEDAASYLSREIYDFTFRHAPTQQFDLENWWAEQDAEDGPRRMGHGRSRELRKDQRRRTRV